MRPDSLDHVALFVRDIARSTAWYRDVLGLERRHEEAWGDDPVVLVARDGASGVALFPARSAASVPDERAPRVFAHLAFRVGGAALRQATGELAARGIPFEEQDHGIARSVYVRDPDGHQVELTTYEVG
ncbi:MAG TPA: VOC family protein [Candidatus Thermoplasmatota archaeon]|nr:VOC family protein [Candidatus Thermoplasmatota archaeon]